MSRPCKVCEEPIVDRGPRALYCLPCLLEVSRRKMRRVHYKRNTADYRECQKSKTALLRADPEYKARELAREKAPARKKAKAEYARRRRAWIRVRKYLADNGGGGYAGGAGLGGDRAV